MHRIDLTMSRTRTTDCRSTRRGAGPCRERRVALLIVRAASWRCRRPFASPCAAAVYYYATVSPDATSSPGPAAVGGASRPRRQAGPSASASRTADRHRGLSSGPSRHTRAILLRRGRPRHGDRGGRRVSATVAAGPGRSPCAPRASGRCSALPWGCLDLTSGDYDRYSFRGPLFHH